MSQNIFANQLIRSYLLGRKQIRQFRVSSLRYFTIKMEVSESAATPEANVTPDKLLSTLDKNDRVIHEGKVEIHYPSNGKIFYNPIQEVNRDISILGIQTYINQEAKEGKEVKILEAMAASGIRSIRYAKELENVSCILANDLSKEANESIVKNSAINGTESIVVPCEMDAKVLMHSKLHSQFVVDVDPYGTPIPFLDSAIQCVQDGGLLLVTATDMALLAGNSAESCFAKYGSMSLKSKACHEIALRIVILAVQGFANRYGSYVEPLISLKIDFYVRILFKVKKGARQAKESVINSSMIFQCTGCKSLNFQSLGIKKKEGHYSFAQGPVVGKTCEFCDAKFHIGGPIWTGPIHNQTFVKSMMDLLDSKYSYLNTSSRIKGLLNLIHEEVETPLFYDLPEICSFFKTSTIPLLKIRSGLLNLNYKVSLSHTTPNSIKTNAPTRVIWDILHVWHNMSKFGDGAKIPEKSISAKLLALPIITEGVNPDIFTLRRDANPSSRSEALLRFQPNPTKFWGPGTRDQCNSDKLEPPQKKMKNQGKRSRKGKRKEQVPTESNQEGPRPMIE